VRIPELYTRREPVISFELFPPKSDEAEAALFRDAIPVLTALRPSFFSVTYGAGGGTRDRSLRITHRIRTDFHVEAMSHVTCVGSTPDMLGDVLNEAKSLGIENVLALRGDPPKGEKEFKPVPGGFRYAVDLIRFVRERGAFAIGAACYPEGHVECSDKRLDWDRTVAKVEAGAQFLITQLFYNIDAYFEFADYMKRRGVKVPIVPGVLPFLGAEQIKRFTTLCGAKLPDELRGRIEALAHDDESVRQLGVEYCTELCQKLLQAGAPGIHLYCLNRATSCGELLRNLGLNSFRLSALGSRPEQP
jgi:methylenetetrahydrofolate reductase (NADPH)